MCDYHTYQHFIARLTCSALSLATSVSFYSELMSIREIGLCGKSDALYIFKDRWQENCFGEGLNIH